MGQALKMASHYPSSVRACGKGLEGWERCTGNSVLAVEALLCDVACLAAEGSCCQLFVSLYADGVLQAQLICLSTFLEIHNLPPTHTSIHCKMSWCCILSCIRQSRMDCMMESCENSPDLCHGLLDERLCPHFIFVSARFIPNRWITIKWRSIESFDEGGPDPAVMLSSNWIRTI